MLTASHWRELPPSLQAVISDVDGLGTDLGVFLERADLLVLRDGACLIAVTPPEHLWPSAGDYAQALRQGDRASLPKLQLIERADLLNWGQRPGGHRPEGHTPEGLSGANTLPTQLIYRSHNSTTVSGPTGPTTQYVSVKSGADGLTASTSELVEDPSLPGGYALRQVSSTNYQNINSLPMIWYASDGAAFGEGDLPHLGLAHQYLNHFRCQSDYQELLYRTAMPVGVRTGVISNAPLAMGAGSASAEVVLGPNSIIDLPEFNIDSGEKNYYIILGFLNPVWNAKDGGEFYLADEKIEYKAGRFFIFPSSVKHDGGYVVNETLSYWRIAVNIILGPVTVRKDDVSVAD